MSKPIIQHTHISSFAEDRINLKQADVQKYREQVNRLRDRLEKYIKENPDYALVKMLHSGSVRKGTALKTINDMDVAIYIRPTEETNEISRLLPWLKDRLIEVYPTMQSDQFIERDHCITVSFAGSGLDVDVVPVIYEEEPDDRGYLIVKDTGDRVLTSISLHLKFIRLRKNAHPYHFAQFIRLLKWWVRLRKSEDQYFRFKSFMVELICAHLADNGLGMDNYLVALQQFFAYIVKTRLEKHIYFEDYYNYNDIKYSSSSIIKIFDPVNPENNIAKNYSTSDRDKIIEYAQDALDALTEAQYATTKVRAIDMWQIIFGSTFREIET